MRFPSHRASRSEPAPSTQVLSSAAPKEKFCKSRKKILDPHPWALPHSVWASPSTRFFESRFPQVWEDENEGGDQLGVRVSLTWAPGG